MKRMKKWLILILISLCMSGCTISEGGVRTAANDGFLLATAQTLSEKMEEFVDSRLWTLYGVSDEMYATIAQADSIGGAGVREAYIVSGDPNLAALIEMTGGGGDLNVRRDWELFAERNHWSILTVSLINAEYGEVWLAAASILETGESYYVPDVDDEEYLVFLPTDGEISTATAFYRAGEDVLAAVTYPVRTDCLPALEACAEEWQLDIRKTTVEQKSGT